MIGNAYRELRETTESIRQLEIAVEIAARLDDAHLEGLSVMSLAASLSYDGDFVRSIVAADRAIDLLTADDRIAAMSQRAGLLQRAGRQSEALNAFSEALDASAAATDTTIRGDLWMNRGVLLGMTGDVDGAESDTQRALDLFVEQGWHKRAVDMRHNLAWLAGRRGDVVDALRRFDDAEAGYEALGLTTSAVFPDRCEVLISAGLADEALAVAESAVRNFSDQGNQVDAAESLLLVGRAALLAADYGRASEAGDEAVRSFAEQGREGWDDAARVLSLEARLANGLATGDERAEAHALAARLRSVGMVGHAVTAILVAAEIAVASGDLDGCDADLGSLSNAHLGLAERFRLDHVTALLAVARDDSERALEVAAASLDEFIGISTALGGSELRAHIARHVERLVDLGASLALAGGDSTTVLQWAERQRSSALVGAPVLPPDDAELEHDFNLLRAAMIGLDERGRSGEDDLEARRRFAAAQDRVRRRSRHLGVAESNERADLIEGVGDINRSGAAWLVFVEAGGELHSVHAAGGATTISRVGRVDDVMPQVELLQTMYSMHMSALGRGRQRDPAALMQAAAEVDHLLFPGGEFDGQRLDGQRVVVCPTSSVFDLPWGLLPTLRSTAFVLAPSIGTAAAADADDRPITNVVAIAGPALQHADDEAESVARAHLASGMLLGEAATADETKRLMQGADIVHLVCHGSFARGNAMFSSLRLHDGELFVYELERLRPAPTLVVLSACNAGLHGSPARGQVLGLTTSLLAGGTRSVVAATVPIPDTVATVDVMTAFHEQLRDGQHVADALQQARLAHPLVGAAFSCHVRP